MTAIIGRRPIRYRHEVRSISAATSRRSRSSSASRKRRTGFGDRSRSRFALAGLLVSNPRSTAVSRICESVTSVLLMLPLLSGFRRCPRLSRSGWPAASAAFTCSRSISFSSLALSIRARTECSSLRDHVMGFVVRCRLDSRPPRSDTSLGESGWTWYADARVVAMAEPGGRRPSGNPRVRSNAMGRRHDEDRAPREDVVRRRPVAELNTLLQPGPSGEGDPGLAGVLGQCM